MRARSARVHRYHDLVAREVRGWYTDWTDGGTGPPEQAAFRVRREPYGYLRQGPGSAGRRLVPTIDDAALMPWVLESAERHFGSPDFDVWVDDRRRAEALGPALVGAGFHAADSTVVLALVGPLQGGDGPDDMEVREVRDAVTLRSWARVKLMGFDDTEDEPPVSRLEEELAVRTGEWPISRYELALMDGEPAAALAHYTASRDQMVFLLATRVPFRHRGLAQAMLGRWVRRATGEGARSLLINCDEHGRPVELYRRMGFVDEVYWQRRYHRAVG